MFKEKPDNRYAKNVPRTYPSKRSPGFQTINIKYWLVPILVIVILESTYFYYCRQQSTQFSPAKLFVKEFTDPVSQLSDLKGDSNSSFGFDSWIRFKSPTPVHLRDAEQFKPSIEEVGRCWFAEKLPNDPALNDSADEYEYVVRSEHGVGQMINETLLVNKKSHDYFYRTWGM